MLSRAFKWNFYLLSFVSSLRNEWSFSRYCIDKFSLCQLLAYFIIFCHDILMQSWHQFVKESFSIKKLTIKRRFLIYPRNSCMLQTLFLTFDTLSLIHSWWGMSRYIGYIFFSVELHRKESLELEGRDHISQRRFYIYSSCYIYRILYIFIYIFFYIFNCIIVFLSYVIARYLDSLCEYCISD